jgi:hypothetical protein
LPLEKWTFQADFSINFVDDDGDEMTEEQHAELMAATEKQEDEMQADEDSSASGSEL